MVQGLSSIPCRDDDTATAPCPDLILRGDLWWWVGGRRWLSWDWFLDWFMNWYWFRGWSWYWFYRLWIWNGDFTNNLLRNGDAGGFHVGQGWLRRLMLGEIHCVLRFWISMVIIFLVEAGVIVSALECGGWHFVNFRALDAIR